MAEITLSLERYMTLLEKEKHLSELDREYDKAEECGIDCQELRSVRGMLGEQMSALKKNYAPKGVAKSSRSV